MGRLNNEEKKAKDNSRGETTWEYFRGDKHIDPKRERRTIELSSKKLYKEESNPS